MSESNKDNFGEELNIIYENLDEKTKKEIDELPKIEFKISLLKTISEPEIKQIYENLKPENRQKIDQMNIRDRYTFLKQFKKKTSLSDKIAKPDTQGNQNIQNIKFVSQERVDEPPLEILKEDLEEDLEEVENIELPQPINLVDNKQNSTELQKQFANLVKLFYNASPYTHSNKNQELEIRFGTKGIKPLNKNDYDNVIKKLKSLGFNSLNELGNSTLKIQSEYLDKNTGKFKLSNTRVSINDLNEIQKYCKSNSIKEIYNKNSRLVSFVNKIPIFIDKQKLFPVNFYDFNFRVSYQIEEDVTLSSKNFIIQNWNKNKKTFRYINRVTFTH